MSYYNLIKLAEKSDNSLHPALSGGAIIGGGILAHKANKHRQDADLLVDTHSIREKVNKYLERDQKTIDDIVKKRRAAQLYRAGAIGAMGAGIGLAGYGAKKLYDRYTK